MQLSPPACNHEPRHAFFFKALAFSKVVVGAGAYIHKR